MIMSYPPSGEGSFRSDLLFLLEQLNEELIIELGKPVPGDDRLPRRSAIHCPTCETELGGEKSED